MNRITEFNNTLKQWFSDHGYDGLFFVEGEDFCYYLNEKCVQYSLFDSPNTDNHFSQFLYEYGAEYICHSFIASLLHEIGHHYTLPLFNQEEKDKDIFAKNTRYHDGTIETNYWYWELPTEFAANMWAIEWINTHYKELCELSDLCAEGLEKIYDDPEILRQILDWKEEIAKGGEYIPLYISIDEEEQ